MKKMMEMRRLLLITCCVIILLLEKSNSRPQFGHHCQYDVGTEIGGMNRPMVVEDDGTGDCRIDVNENGEIKVSSSFKSAQIVTSDKGRFVYDSSRHENAYCEEPVVGVYINAPVFKATYLWEIDNDEEEVRFVATCASFNRAVQTSVTIRNVKVTKHELNIIETKKEITKKRVQFRFKPGVRLIDKTAPDSFYHNVYYVCQSFDLRHLKEYDATGFRILEDTSELGAQFIRGPVVGENIDEPSSSSARSSARSGGNIFVHHAVVFAWYSENELETTTRTRGFPDFQTQKESPFVCRFFPYKRLMFAWSGGDGTLHLPEDVGFRIPNYITIQAHYMIPAREGKNRDREVGLRLSSSIVTDRFGLELIVEPQQQRKSAGYMVLGSRNDRVLSEEIYIPSGMTHFEYQSSCFSSRCRLNWPRRIYLTGLLFHTHFLGRQLRFVTTSNSKIRTLASAHVGRNNTSDFDGWDPSNPTMMSTSETIFVDPSERLALTCTYDSSSRDHQTIGGLGALNEMCWVFAFYYDRFDHELGTNQKNSDGCCFTGSTFVLAPKFYPPLQRDSTDSNALQYDDLGMDTSLLKDFSPYLLMGHQQVRQSGIDSDDSDGHGMNALLFLIIILALGLIYYLLYR